MHLLTQSTRMNNDTAVKSGVIVKLLNYRRGKRPEKVPFPETQYLFRTNRFCVNFVYPHTRLPLAATAL